MSQQAAEILKGQAPFCLIHREDRSTLLLLRGSMRWLSKIEEIPTHPASGKPGDVASLSLIPYSQAKERGFVARQEGEKLLCLVPDAQIELPIDEIAALLPTDEAELEGEPVMEPSEEEYQKGVAAIVRDEIGNGEGANFNFARAVKGRIRDFRLDQALSIYRKLLKSDYGTYWKFLLWTGEACFIGSTPEKHLSVDKGTVVMNPISGTFRKNAEQSPAEFRKSLRQFLVDPKEINELFMVVDEELKMMAQMCDKGGIVAGPFLKEMSRLIHTEYHLIGESTRPVLQNLKDSMFAATVVGSPLENAFRIIHKYEPGARRYYAASIAVTGLDEDGEVFLDSPILIRTVEIQKDGSFALRVGATIVHDSKPEAELAETKAKGGAVLDLLLGQPRPAMPKMLEGYTRDPLILETLLERNQRLASFWFNRQNPELAEREFSGLKVTLIDHEDDFLHMFGHMLHFLGAEVTRLGWRDYDAAKDKADLTVLGPGPGDPENESEPKMKRAMENLRALRAQGRPLFGVCLGHQFLCRHLGLPIRRRPQATQGVQQKLEIFGKPELCGFYNTFYGIAKDPQDPRLLSLDPQTQEIYALHDPAQKLLGFQFHPESILSQNGLELIRKGLRRLLGR